MNTLLFRSVILCCLLYLLFPIKDFREKSVNDKSNFRFLPGNRFDPSAESRIIQQASILRKFLVGKKFNHEYCFLVDMRIPSGKNRFFVVDLSKDSVLTAGLVAHGHCQLDYCPQPIFSNQAGSCCTSLGKYRIGRPYVGAYGKAYKLFGLDSSNSHAFLRNIVLHGHFCTPATEIDPVLICNSSGCPMVSASFLKKLEPIIDRSTRPIILWIFN